MAKSKPPSPPVRLVVDRRSSETIDVLRQLLTAAEMGEIVGIAFAAIYKNRSYIVDTAGEARRCPTFTRGTLRALDDFTAELVGEGSASS